MTRSIGIVSSKGGVGRTTIALNLGLTLTNFGREVVVLDASFSVPHIGMHLGFPILPNSLNDVLDGKKTIEQAVYAHSSGLKIVPLHISASHYPDEKLRTSIDSLKRKCEAVLLDTPAGLGRDAADVIRLCDEALLVTSPDMPSVTEALKTKSFAKKQGSKIIGAVVNRARHDNVEMGVKNIERMLGVPVLEVIPEDDAIRHSLHLKHPVTYSHPESMASIQFKKLAARLIGDKYVEALEQEEGTSKFEKILKELGLK